MTAREYMDEVMLRLTRFNIFTQINEPLLLTYVNNARQEVQRITAPLYPERYGNIVNQTVNVLTQPINLTFVDEIMDVFVVLLMYIKDGVLYRNEARKAISREQFNIYQSKWNQPSLIDPVYTVYRNNNNNPIWVIDINAGDLSTVTAPIYIIVYYTQPVWFLDYQDNDFTIPMEYQEFVILYTMYYCLLHLKLPEVADIVNASIGLMKQTIEVYYQEKKQRQLPLIPSKEGV